MTKQIKRTKKGRFAKGTGPGPGKRSKKVGSIPTSQEIRDAFYKAFVQIFAKSGDPKKLVEFCKKNQLNQRLLIQEIRKLLPEMAEDPRDGPHLLVVNRIITDDREVVEGPSDKDIAEMKRDGYEMSDKFLPKDNPVKESELSDSEKMTDEQLQKKIKELEEKKASVLAALAEKRPSKSKSTN